MENNRPLTIQSDRTMLLDVHSPYAKDCREDIIAFSDLIKSPEHIHTYALSNLSLWNAISSGLSADEIVSRLKKWSRYEIDQKILYYIDDQARRFGDFILEEFDEKNLILKVRRKVFFLQLQADRNLKE
jgi:DNA excision repair protein ERCC-3